MKLLVGLCAVGLAATLGLAGSPARADVFGYGVDTQEKLYSVDLSTASATLIGSTGQFLEGLALTPGGGLFGTSSAGNLYSIDPTTGAATLIGNTGRGNIEGLHYNGNTLVGVDFSGTPTLFSIDPTTAATTNIVTSVDNTGSVRAMTALDSNNMLLRTDNPGPNTLRSINLTTGATTVIGNITSPSIVPGLDFATDGNLYGLNGQGDELLIDPATAATTVVGNTGGQFWLDLAAAPGHGASPVPEPCSLALIALGSGPLLGLRRRRTRR